MKKRFAVMLISTMLTATLCGAGSISCLASSEEIEYADDEYASDDGYFDDDLFADEEDDYSSNEYTLDEITEQITDDIADKVPISDEGGTIILCK